MATYTTNYNLYMPDSTDPVGDFRAEFNNNMQTIDANLGGGGGSSSLAGLTDVSLSAPTNGQVLTYDSVAQKWKNANGGGGGGGHNYSTSEQVIGTWIDGKPLYQITVDVPTPVNDSNEHLIDLTALSIEECPYLFGYAVRHSGANDITYYANSIETDGWYYFKARYDNFRDSIMYICLFKNDSISRMKFTIQYTKTTD